MLLIYLLIGRKGVKLKMATINPKVYLVLFKGYCKDLRLKCLEKLILNDFDGYAMGGLAVGELKEMFKILDETVGYLQKQTKISDGSRNTFRYIRTVSKGIDMFDCVLPTRSGRTGLAFTWSGSINLKNSKCKRHITFRRKLQIKKFK